MLLTLLVSLSFSPKSSAIRSSARVSSAGVNPLELEGKSGRTVKERNAGQRRGLHGSIPRRTEKGTEGDENCHGALNVCVNSVRWCEESRGVKPNQRTEDCELDA